MAGLPFSISVSFLLLLLKSLESDELYLKRQVVESLIAILNFLNSRLPLSITDDI